jgi:hypothetical protein
MININDISKRYPLKEKGNKTVFCNRCGGCNLSASESLVSSADYAAACLDCDEDMFAFELHYCNEENQKIGLTAV